MTADGFSIIKRSGDAFYGVPNLKTSHFLAKLLPQFAGTIHILIQRNQKDYVDGAYKETVKFIDDTNDVI